MAFAENRLKDRSGKLQQRSFEHLDEGRLNIGMSVLFTVRMSSVRSIDGIIQMLSDVQ